MYETLSFSWWQQLEVGTSGPNPSDKKINKWEIIYKSTQQHATMPDDRLGSAVVNKWLTYSICILTIQGYSLIISMF
jgi:hypothetical protein